MKTTKHILTSNAHTQPPLPGRGEEGVRHCYHCGEDCKTTVVHFDEKDFCCDGCKLVYDLLKENNLCTYYTLNDAPGAAAKQAQYSEKYKYLDNEEINQKLIKFKEGNQVHITFFIPKMHCSSCIWLLENLHKLNAEIISSTVNFLRKEVSIVYNQQHLQLSSIAALLENIGYEPLISLNDLEQKKEKANNKSSITKIGIAGFCFGNIMMLSFPEYFSLGNFFEQPELKVFFGYLNLVLALPVFFYSASEFFVSAFKSIRQRYLNIDAPIALAIAVTFFRSVFEIISKTGTGYIDSMAGIVFFMLIGRYFQNRTYQTLSFERDYKSYFPIAVTIENGTAKTSVPVSEVQVGDRMIIRNNELIPADAKLLSASTHIDYSFVTGESAPVKKVAGDLIYAGGKQLDGAVKLEVVKEVSQSYLTQLWNNDAYTHEQKKSSATFVNKVNKYFTTAVLSIAAAAALFWLIVDASRAISAFTAVLIIACPCGLLLASTFTNGNMLRLFGKSKFYLKNNSVIEELSRIDTIVFDKTGTITHGSTVQFMGPKPDEQDLQIAASLASQSAHPLSRKIMEQFLKGAALSTECFEEIPNNGIKGYVNGKYAIMGSEYFVTGTVRADAKNQSSKVFYALEGEILGYFSINNSYRPELDALIRELSKQYNLNLLSGDNDVEKEQLKKVFGNTADLRFNQKPEDKLHYIQQLQQKGQHVLMIGDGLNDAGALKQSNAGIAVSDDINNFSPACDAILDGSSFAKINSFLSFAKAGKKIITASFIISTIYNVIGLSHAVQGTLSPVIAAILMPISSVSIVLLTTLASSVVAKRRGL